MGMTVNVGNDEGSLLLPRGIGIYSIIDKTTNDHPVKERIRAVIALGESDDPRAVRPLIDCCRDRNPEIRWHAIEALGSIRSGRSVDVLIERLQDTAEPAEIRQRAALALVTVGNLSAIEGLRETLRMESTPPLLKSRITSLLGRTMAP
jgi:HEAT repeat protein